MDKNNEYTTCCCADEDKLYSLGEKLPKESDKNNEPNIFETLYKINVNNYIEEKNKLSYLSWTYAWAEAKKRFPNLTYKIHLFGEKQLPYVYDENTGYMVFTEITIDGLTHIMWLPVMDSTNKAMKNKPYTYEVDEYIWKDKKKIKTGNKIKKTVESATMFDINKTIMRCLVKNLAMFGLGLYIYAGEDLPETPGEVVSKLPAKPQDEKTKLLKGIYKIALEQLEEKTGKSYKDMSKEDLCTEFTDLKSKSIKKNN